MAFSICNTFSILAGLAETLVIGVVGSVAGWAGGIGIAALLKGVFNGFGFALPAGGLVLRTSSSVLAVVVGVAATVLAGVLPALRSSRVPPLAALRELAAEPSWGCCVRSGRPGRRRAAWSGGSR
jgi:putative ABC transport system permease protein